MAHLRPGLLALCCAVALLSLGCLSASDDSLESEVQDRLADAEPLEELVATQETMLDGENQSFSVTQDVWYHVGGLETYHLVLEPKEGDGNEDNEESGVSVFDGIANPLSGIESGDDGGEVNDTVGTVPQRAEIWFDQERLFPVKYLSETEEITSETVFRDVEFDPGIPAERFEFEPPENATVEQDDLPDTERYDDIDAANEAAPFEMSEPSFVPEEYEFDEASVTEFEDDNRTASTLFYRSGEQEFVTVQITDGEFRFESEGETVDIGGRNGTYSVDERIGTRDGIRLKLAWLLRNTIQLLNCASELTRNIGSRVAMYQPYMVIVRVYWYVHQTHTN